MTLATATETSRFGAVFPPEFVPSTLVRVVFDGTETGTALALETSEGPLTLLPWSSSQGKVAGYGVGETGETIPVELGAKALRRVLDRYEAETVPLEETPAQALLGSPGQRDVAVSWHARVRWAERVREDTYPAPRIHAALTDAVELSRHRGWYNPSLGVRIPIQGPGPIFEDRLDADWIAKTVISVDEDDRGFDR